MANQAQAKVMTNGKKFTDISMIQERAVKFTIQDKGVCVVGFAKDRNTFMQSFNDVIKETTKWQVLNDLRKYQGADAIKLMKIVKELKPVVMTSDVCHDCGVELGKSVANFSVNHYGVPLCRQHQVGKDRLSFQRASEASAPINVPRNLVEGKRTMEVPCSKCRATGYIRMYNHVEGGVCFRCKGTTLMTITEGSAEWRAYEKKLQEAQAQHQPQPGDVVLKPTHVGICDICDDGEGEEVQLYHSETLNHSACLSCCTEAELSLRNHGLEVQEMEFTDVEAAEEMTRPLAYSEDHDEQEQARLLLEEKTVPQLKAMAKAAGIRGYSSMVKAALVHALL